MQTFHKKIAVPNATPQSGAPLLVHAPCSNPNCLKTVAMAWGGVDPVSRQQRCRRCAIYRSNHGVERIPDPEDHIVRRDNIPPRARGQLGGIMVAPPPPPPPHSLPPPAPAATMQPQRITAGAMYWAPYFLPRSRAVQDPQYRYPSPPSHPY